MGIILSIFRRFGSESNVLVHPSTESSCLDVYRTRRAELFVFDSVSEVLVIGFVIGFGFVYFYTMHKVNPWNEMPLKKTTTSWIVFLKLYSFCCLMIR